MESLYDRLKIVARLRYASIGALCDALGIKRSRLTWYINKTTLSNDMRTLLRRNNINPEYLETGEGPMFLDEKPAERAAEGPAPNTAAPQPSNVTQVDPMDFYRTMDKIPFTVASSDDDQAETRRVYASMSEVVAPSVDRAMAFQITGDALAADGVNHLDVIIVGLDSKNLRPVEGRRFFCRINGLFYILRIVDFKGNFWLISENEAVRPSQWLTDPKIEIFGEIVSIVKNRKNFIGSSNDDMKRRLAGYVAT